jgi:hypothetical protein
MFTTKIQATLPQFQRHSLRYTVYSGTHYSMVKERLVGALPIIFVQLRI